MRGDLRAYGGGDVALIELACPWSCDSSRRPGLDPEAETSQITGKQEVVQHCAIGAPVGVKQKMMPRWTSALP